MPTARPADPHAQLRIDIDLLAADPDAVVREHADPAIGSRHPDVAVFVPVVLALRERAPEALHRVCSENMRE